MSVKDVRDRIMKNDDNIRNLERERQRTSNLVRDALDREAQTLAHRREQVSAKKREADSAVTDETSPKTRRLIIGLTIVFLVGAAVSVGLAVTSTAGLYLVAQDAFCAATNGYFTPDYRTYSAAYEALDSSPLPIVHSEAHNRSLFWGTYRPHLLAGVKSREKQPLLFGIGWYDLESRFGVRHVAEETNEVHFAWEVHDSRTTGRQIIRDYANNLDINVRFLKSPDGFGWTMRIDGTRRGGGANRKPIAFFLYFATELTAPAYDPHQPLLTIESDAKELSAVPHSKLESGAFSTGATLRVGGKLANGHHFHASVQDSAGAWLMDSQWEAFTWPSKAEQWQMDFRRGDRIQEHRQFHKHPKQYGSILMKKQVTNSFRFDVKLTEHNTIDSTDAFPNSCTVSRLLADREAAFHRRFEDTFQIRAKATALRQVAQGIPEVPVLVRMAETAVSNMLGGLGYWYGEYWVKTAKGHKVEGPVALFSGVPSRAKFPRGFLWDEGFHQLLVARWDAPLSKDIILHWIDGDVVNRTTGWIPREQILGAEPRTRVPNEFVAQNRQHTNPPAMILQVENFARMTSDPNDPFLDRALPAVRRWLRFLKASQCGGSADCATKPLTAANASHLFRWRSRNNFHLLASGLDDYPRPHCKPDWAELHVDLFSWAAMMQKTVDAIEHRLAGPSPSDSSCEDTSSDSCEKPAAIATAGDQTSTRQSSASWADALETIHYDERRQRYSDVTGCTTDRANSKYYSHYFGYVNLFPFLNMVIERPDRALELMRQAKAELSGGYGLQSLSNTSRKQLREHEDYWTGPIWINLNYMMLRALKVKYIPMLGAEAEEFYHELRADLIRNIGREFARTGKLWENYDLRTGQGRGTAPFTGWTALVVAIIAEQY